MNLWMLLLLAPFWPSSSRPLADAQRQLADTKVANGGAPLPAGDPTLPYYLYKPTGIDSALPLVLFLHGAGERGTDGRSHIRNGLDVLVSDSFQKRHPCVVLAPQCPPTQKWVDVDWKTTQHDMPAEMNATLAQAKALLHDVLNPMPDDERFSAIKKGRAYLDTTKTRIDKGRIYVVGLSMGGYGAWDILARNPNLFAAGVVLCGGADTNTAPLLALMPMLAIHGAKDGAVPVSRSRAMQRSLVRAGSTVAQYTELPNAGHDVWTAAFHGMGTMDWLFSQSRLGRPVVAPAPLKAAPPKPQPGDKAKAKGHPSTKAKGAHK